MSQLAWPRESDLLGLLQSCGLVSSPATSLEGLLGLDRYIVSAREAWERENGFEPYMAPDPALLVSSPTTYTRRFTPNQDYTLDLDGGLTAAPTSITTGVTLTSAGTVLVVDRDFFMRPERALNKSRSYTYVQFYARQYGPRDSIRILGSWGGCPYQAIQQSVWDAVLMDAARRAYPQIEFKISQGLVSYKVGNALQETFAKSPLGTLVSGASQQWEDAKADFGRPGFP